MTNIMSDNDSITLLGGTSETSENDWNDFWGEDGISLTGNPYYSYDTIKFTMSENENGTLNFSEETICAADTVAIPSFDEFGKDFVSFNLNNSNGFWKYNEDKILKEIKEYLGSTYKSHYTSQESKTQTLDLIESIGDAEPFCRSNAIKYLSRFGKKNGKSKMDILKAIHYCILLYHFAGLCNENTQPYETFR